MECAGYVKIPVQWFDADAPSNEVKAFTLYRKDGGELMPNPDLRNFWVDRIQPVYCNHKGRDPATMPLIQHYDTKSNPRRIHPYAYVYHEWCQRVHRKEVPLCILKPCVLPISACSNYREGLASSMDYLYEYSMHDGRPALIRLQSWWRYLRALKLAQEMRLDPDMMFALPPKSRELYIRLSKAGIDASTYNIMCAPVATG